MDSTSPCTRGGVWALQNKGLFPVGVSWPPELYFLPTSTWDLELHGKGKVWSLGKDKHLPSPGLEKAGKHRVAAVTLYVLDPSLVQLLGCCCLLATSKIQGRTRSFEGTTDLSVHAGTASGCIWKIGRAWHFYMGLQSLKFFFSGKDLWRIYCFLFPQKF